MTANDVLHIIAGMANNWWEEEHKASESRQYRLAQSCFDRWCAATQIIEEIEYRIEQEEK